VPNDLTTGFVRRLRAREPEAWFELWENFGPILRAQLSRWGRGRIGAETVKDLSQETLAALSGAIDRHDPSKGARFSTWLLAIARHTLGDEIDRRMARKRGYGVRPLSLDDAGERPGAALGPDVVYERAVFDAKVAAALRSAERECGFAEFDVYRMRVLKGRSGREVAAALGTSEATISRRLASARGRIRTQLYEVFSKYSFTDEEWQELSRNGLELSPTKKGEASFDDAVADVYHRFARSGAAGPGTTDTTGTGRRPQRVGRKSHQEEPLEWAAS
jgi:RNA polymerase sigma factor (sigma-70 family)